MDAIWTDGVFEIEVEVEGCINCRGAEWEVGVTRLRDQRFFLVFRCLGCPEWCFFLAKRSWGKRLEVLAEPVVQYEKPSLAIWRESLEILLELGAWGRVLWFDEQGQVCSSAQDTNWLLFLLPDGRSVWGQAPALAIMDRVDVFPFDRGDNAPPVQESSARQWLDWVAQALSESTDCQFAFTFARLALTEKMNFALTWRGGDYQDFEHVCRCLAWLSIDWEGLRDDQTLLASINLEDPKNAYIRSEHSWALPNVKKARKMWAWAIRTGQPTLRALLDEHESTAMWLKRQPLYIELQVSPPNAHERLEAIVFLRQWARGLGVEKELIQRLGLQKSR